MEQGGGGEGADGKRPRKKNNQDGEGGKKGWEAKRQSSGTPPQNVRLGGGCSSARSPVGVVSPNTPVRAGVSESESD